MKFTQPILLLSLFALLGSLGCEHKSTLGVTDSGVLVQKADYRKLVKAEAIVFDTRSPFDFNTNKVPGSINLPVRDFDSSPDPLDAARRLSLYGVDLTTPVVIIGEGHGDEQKLAWEFTKLGITQIETLKTDVFRLLNTPPEPAKKNVTLWKPLTIYGEMNRKQFAKKMDELQPKPESHARTSVFQGFPVATALRMRTLVLTKDKDWSEHSKYLFADQVQFNPENIFDENGLINREKVKKTLDLNLKVYDAVFLFDSGENSAAHAYALVQAGAKSLYLVH